MWGRQSVFMWNQAVLCDIFTFNPDTRTPPSAWPQSTHTVGISQWLSVQFIWLIMFRAFHTTKPSLLLYYLTVGEFDCVTRIRKPDTAQYYRTSLLEKQWSHTLTNYFTIHHQWPVLYLFLGSLPLVTSQARFTQLQLFSFVYISEWSFEFVYLQMTAELASHKAPTLHCIPR